MTPSSEPCNIHAEDVCREYRLGDAVVHAVAGITLAVPAGEFLALLGSSGSGKSTLFRIAADQIAADRGQVQGLAARHARGAAGVREDLNHFQAGLRADAGGAIARQ